METEYTHSPLPWVVLVLLWLWGWVPHSVGEVRRRLAAAERELKRVDARLGVFEKRAAKLYREVREYREQHRHNAEPSGDEADLSSHLEDIKKARESHGGERR